MHNAIIGKKSIFSIMAIVVCLFCCSLQSTFAQVKTITGKVIALDTKETIIGATIAIKGTTRGTLTDLDGNFSLQLQPNDAVLIISFVGYTSQEIAITDQPFIAVSLVQERT